jgi:outer membrane protein OmpA-like peptidoglycan-associated protein
MFEQELLDVAKLLQDNPTIKLDLVGHSDNDEQNETKTNKSYIGLAQTRAEAIKKFLTENGVDASRVSVSGKDNTAPATDKATPLGKAQNRRVEFSVK